MFCSNCGLQNDIGAKFCTGCGNVLNKQEISQTNISSNTSTFYETAELKSKSSEIENMYTNNDEMPYKFASNNEKYFNYAGFWRRVVSYFIDMIILGAISVIIYLPSVIFHPSESELIKNESALIPFVVWIVLASIFIAIVSNLYFMYMESSKWQATIGKLIMGIKVVDLQGQRISFLRAVGRNFAKIISGMIMYIGFLMVAFTEKKQGLHDMMAGTLVVIK